MAKKIKIILSHYNENSKVSQSQTDKKSHVLFFSMVSPLIGLHLLVLVLNTFENPDQERNNKFEMSHYNEIQLFEICPSIPQLSDTEDVISLYFSCHIINYK